MKTITLRSGKSESLKRFHPWIFSGAIQKADEGLQEGDLVRVVDHEGDFLAIGHCQVGSIAVRVLTFEDEAIEATFWENRLRSAWAVRQTEHLIGEQQNDIYRLVHGEGDRLPGLVVDVYKDTAVLQAHSVGMHFARQSIAVAIVKVAAGRIKNVYYKSETTLPYKADLGQENGFLIGESENNIATEYGLSFYIDWLRGQKTGFFIDQRENRRLLEHYSKDRKVLNMFCYTGGFSIYALRGEAEAVHSVDSSEKAIELTKKNVELNFPHAVNHKAYAEDAFKYLERMGGNYDLIVLDPPAFAKHKGALRNAIKGYTRLNAIAFEKIQKGGIVFTFSCSQAVDKEQFKLAVFTAAARSKRHVRILHQLHQPADHPISIYHPEGEYLKGLVLQVD